MTPGPVDGTRTLEQLDGARWGDPPEDATRLIRTVHRLRHKPVGQLDVEDLRVLLLQQISPDVLVPLALAVLEADPLAEGDFYPGDLLVAVLKLPARFRPAGLDQVLARAETLDAFDDVSAAVQAYRTGH